MEPGPDLDAEIARKVLNVIVISDTETGQYQLRDTANKKFVDLPPYSTDTGTAYQLVSKFKAAGCTFRIVPPKEDSLWNVEMTHPKIAGVNFGSKGITLPHAICQAILQFNQLFKLG